MSRGLILIGIDAEEVRKTLAKLEPEKQNKALQKALKETAKQARERLGEKAQNSYTVKKVGFKKEMRIRSSSGKNPSATIHSEGEPLPLLRFKYSRAMNTTRAQILKHGSLKKLERGGIKAFIGKIAPASQDKKHIAIAQRKGKERLEINEKFSKSVPSMLGSVKHVYGKVEPYIGEDLTRNLEKFVKEALRR